MYWTFTHSRLAPPLSGNRIQDAVTGDLVAELRFYGTTMPADIPHEQLRNLEPGQWLTADLCSFYCYEVGNAYLEGAPGRWKDLVVLHSRTWDLRHWTAGAPQRVRVPGALQVLEHKYVAFPGNDTDSHFFLCIIIFPRDLLYDLNPNGTVRTMALILNSLQDMQPRNPERKIRDILRRLADGRQLREPELQDINVYLPMMPQQPNMYDCGLYPGHFLSVFLSAPETYIAHCTGKASIDGPLDIVWKHERVKAARDRLKSLVLASSEIRQAALDFNTDIPSPCAM
ncbi:hypothetical protein M407DRAFT_30946 [Tulasnella calospora MUT 4182]|uniref:Ubiquitin-like protease family profile domain-containing protein n=1 Tax=Tulasnella calospora MUT 4182 TaxID=1051891 RepID=A0A0C3Q6I4_9AGAM|nr:hypothetical protein M407DRAFT_30946 [Tulasnella calospora MUT 4182]